MSISYSKPIAWALLLSLCLGLLISSGQAQAADPTYLYKNDAWYLRQGEMDFKLIPDVLTVRFTQEVATADHLKILDRMGLIVERHNKLRFYDLKLPEGILSHEKARELKADPRFEHAFPGTVGEFIVHPDDPEYSSQWSKHNTGSGGGKGGSGFFKK